MSSDSPLLHYKYFGQPAVFNPENLLRETRRRKALPTGAVPPVCLLDPDGDIVAYLLENRQATRDSAWACYHTILHGFEREGLVFGVIGCAVGGPFAVLLAEQLGFPAAFRPGCSMLES